MNILRGLIQVGISGGVMWFATYLGYRIVRRAHQHSGYSASLPIGIAAGCFLLFLWIVIGQTWIEGFRE